jgi:hypothetical protein
LRDTIRRRGASQNFANRAANPIPAILILHPESRIAAIDETPIAPSIAAIALGDNGRRAQKFRDFFPSSTRSIPPHASNSSMPVERFRSVC